MKKLIKAFFAGKLTYLNPWFYVTTLLLLIVLGGIAYLFGNDPEEKVYIIIVGLSVISIIDIIGATINYIIKTYTLDEIKDGFMGQIGLVGIWIGVAIILHWFGVDEDIAIEWPLILGTFLSLFVFLICIVYCLYIKIKSFIDKCKVALDSHD